MFMIYFLHAFCSNDCNINHCFMLRIFFFPDAIFLISSLGGCGEININDRYVFASASFLSVLPPIPVSVVASYSINVKSDLSLAQGPAPRWR